MTSEKLAERRSPLKDYDTPEIDSHIVFELQKISYLFQYPVWFLQLFHVTKFQQNFNKRDVQRQSNNKSSEWSCEFYSYTDYILS